MEEIAMDTNKYCFGIRDTVRALEMGAVETLIVFENLNMIRIELKNPTNDEKKIEYLTNEQFEEKQEEFMKDEKTGITWDIVQQDDFLEWLAENYKNFGAKLEFVTDRSQEGAQFVKGFSGIGGFLRWQINWVEMDDFIGMLILCCY